MMANCTSHSGRASAFAPLSVTTISLPRTRNDWVSAGRFTPRIRLKVLSVASARAAPLFPAVTKASALPSRTRFMPTIIDESRLVRATWLGLSCMSTVWLAWTISRFSPCLSYFASSRSMAAWSPTRIIVSLACRAACTAPSTSGTGHASLPIASTAILILPRLSGLHHACSDDQMLSVSLVGGKGSGVVSPAGAVLDQQLEDLRLADEHFPFGQQQRQQVWHVQQPLFILHRRAQDDRRQKGRRHRVFW